MKIKTKCKLLLALFGLLTVQMAVKAGTIINNFDNGFDYLASGVPGTMWDGVYLGSGDIFGGNDGGDAGFTLQANETANPGYLTIQDNLTDWSGTSDDGFFLYKVVAGDFDVSVENVEPFDNSDPANNHMGGLMARAFPTSGPHWSAPFNGGENWQDVFRFMQFSIDEDIRYATNGADNDGYIIVPGVDTDTNVNRFFRITRVGDVFSFYTKTNQPDAWTLHGSLTRGDLAGVPIQVGLADATFGDGTGGGTVAAPQTFYTDFELTGTNVVAAPTPPADPTGLTSVVASVTNQTYTWTPGAGSAGSILVIRKDNPLSLQQKPIDGYSYTTSNHFGSGDDLGGGIYVVFAGAASSVTVSGLGTTNHTYYAAVYSYSGSGASTVYGANPATENNVGPNQYVGLNLTTVGSLGVSVGGAAVDFLTANDAYGNTDSVPTISAAWSSTAPSIALVGADGTITGVGVGTAQIIASYSGLSTTNAVTVHAPAYTENFGASHDYLANGLPGTTWNGLYLTGNDIPNASFGGSLAKYTAFDVNTASNNSLNITAAFSGWQGGQDNGPFLFQNVPGDFEASVHITSYSIVNYEFVGLQARAYSLADNASPSGPGFSENFVDWLRFDEFTDTSLTFNTVNGGNAETDQNDGETNNYWLLMVRDSGTNFYFFKRASLTNAWAFQPAETIVRPDLTNGVPLQVGLVQSMFTGTYGNVQFDSFALDAASISGGTPPSATMGLNIALNPSFTSANLSWIPGTNGDGSLQSTMVLMRKGAPVSAQPYFGILTGTPPVPDNFGDSTDFGGGNFLVYRGGGSNATVNGLIPGVQYYVAVYGFSSSGATKSFNLLGSVSGVTPPVTLTGITATLPGDGIPVNGVGIPVVTGNIMGGGTLDVTKGAVITSGNPGIMLATNGVISGFAIGTATNAISVVNGTNTFNTTLVATVRAADYTDNFATSHDYVAIGVTNTTWDGVYAYPKFTIPDTTFTSSGTASILSADANTTSNNVLTITSENVGFENAQDDGFFLFKYVPADFQMAVHISTSLLATNAVPIAAYNYPGLLARPYRTDTNGIVGAPFYTNGDSFVSWARFDEFGIGSRAESIIRGGTTSLPSADVGDEQRWLLMVRHNGTNFTFYQKANLTDPWLPGPAGQQFNLTNYVGAAMQVGIMEGGFDSGNVVTGQFDSFSLDVGQPVLKVAPSGNSVILSWPALSGYTLQRTLSLSPSSWQPVANTPTTLNGVSSVSLPASGNSAFFRLTH
jgi:hypothetical protein